MTIHHFFSIELIPYFPYFVITNKTLKTTNLKIFPVFSSSKGDDPDVTGNARKTMQNRKKEKITPAPHVANDWQISNCDLLFLRNCTCVHETKSASLYGAKCIANETYVIFFCIFLALLSSSSTLWPLWACHNKVSECLIVWPHVAQSLRAC